ncbi:tagatose 1,6-diphosphate aldolase [Ktedonobacter sp. SOSP1-85]|uniref:tagatose 1,6-diphosphate aldolase n=1 Tax=Ktedonobacter sp. SOSP1-85 TaxID=2778367 RepID=UPI001A1BAC37|nr:tagatose 1,6-diphosphate aldolase [Ktedonobacter sp. SOSP1-85]GHO79161.1 tagatose 1,6-diphosphate aldolase [Ktedonobacter sp. SOSP1-85]
MGKIQMSRGKFEHLQACTNADGIIAAVAMDQRNSLKKSMEKLVEGSGTPEAITTFKRKVSQVLTRYASAILLDPEYGLPALQERVQGRGALLSYEVTGYDPLVVGRLPRLLPNWSARRLIEVGTDAVKILLYYNPADVGWINEIKQAFVERVGDECRALDIPFFLEPLAYDNMHPEQSFEFACLKPGYVRSIIEEFSRPRYGVDMLKVEIPINSAYLAGSHGFKGNQVAYDWQEAREHFQALAAISSLPFIFLSGGVDDVIFREQLELAAEASIPFSGVLCGRATWKGGIPVFVNNGEAALEEWLQEQGVQNVQTLNAVLSQCARPWHTIYGGLEAIQVTD